MKKKKSGTWKRYTRLGIGGDCAVFALHRSAEGGVQTSFEINQGLQFPFIFMLNMKQVTYFSTKKSHSSAQTMTLETKQIRSHILVQGQSCRNYRSRCRYSTSQRVVLRGLLICPGSEGGAGYRGVWLFNLQVQTVNDNMQTHWPAHALHSVLVELRRLLQ